MKLEGPRLRNAFENRAAADGQAVMCASHLGPRRARAFVVPLLAHLAVELTVEIQRDVSSQTRLLYQLPILAASSPSLKGSFNS